MLTERRIVRALPTLVAVIVPFVLSAGCVGDDAIPAGPSSDASADSTTPDGGGGVDSGALVDAATDAPVDASVPVTGDFESLLALEAVTTLRGVAVADDGDAVLAGSLNGKVTISGFVHESKGSRDAFVVRVAPNNGIKWVKLLGGPGTDDAHAVALDAAGNVYVVGTYNGGGAAGDTATFGGTTLVPLHAGGSSFVAKLDGKTGNTVWALSFDTAASTAGSCQRVVARASSLAVACGLNGELSFTAANGSPTTRPMGTSGAWVAELDASNGRVSRGLTLTGSQGGVVDGLAFDANDNLFVSGSTGSATLTGDTPSFTLTRKGTGISSVDTWVVKLAPGAAARTLVWSQVYGAGTVSTQAGGLATAPDGSVYLGGTFQGTRDFGKGELTAAGLLDRFVLHLSADAGATLHQTSFGGTGVAMATGGLAVDDVGNPILTTNYAGTGFMFGGEAMPDAPAQNRASILAKFSPDLSKPHFVKKSGIETGINDNFSGVRHAAVATNTKTGQSLTVGSLHGKSDLGDGKLTERSGGSYLIRHKR